MGQVVGCVCWVELVCMFWSRVEKLAKSRAESVARQCVVDGEKGRCGW
jgi:hypothetical protein